MNVKTLSLMLYRGSLSLIALVGLRFPDLYPGYIGYKKILFKYG
jgi:hypothetical protein